MLLVQADLKSNIYETEENSTIEELNKYTIHVNTKKYISQVWNEKKNNRFVNMKTL